MNVMLSSKTFFEFHLGQIYIYVKPFNGMFMQNFAQNKGLNLFYYFLSTFLTSF